MHSLCKFTRYMTRQFKNFYNESINLIILALSIHAIILTTQRQAHAISSRILDGSNS